MLLLRVKLLGERQTLHKQDSKVDCVELGQQDMGETVNEGASNHPKIIGLILIEDKPNNQLLGIYTKCAKTVEQN